MKHVGRRGEASFEAGPAWASWGQGKDMTTDIRIEKLTRHGIALLQEERELALAGNFGALEELNERKQAYLDQLDALAVQLDGAGPQPLREARRQELQTLFDIIRRRADENRYLLKAAEAGVQSARRDLDQLFSGELPLGAYGENGAPISSGRSGKIVSERI